MLVAVTWLLVLVGCSPSAVELVPPPQLSDGWSVGSLADAGFDQVELAQLTAEIEAGAFPNTHALLIEHDGSLVYERYFSGTDERWGGSLGNRTFDRDGLHDLRSISKSVTSALLGIALGEGFDDAVQRPVGSYLPALTLPDEVESVTLHHVLTMTAGLAWNEMDVPYTDATNDETSRMGPLDRATHRARFAIDGNKIQLLCSFLPSPQSPPK